MILRGELAFSKLKKIFSMALLTTHPLVSLLENRMAVIHVLLRYPWVSIICDLGREPDLAMALSEIISPKWKKLS